VFALPNQDELTQSGFLVMDDAHYSLKFKAYNRFGKYYFDNPKVYAEHYKDLEAFKNYVKIVSCFYEDLETK
jgi:hypothetical protein